MKLTYTVGDATYPQRGATDTHAVIVHCCNDIGKFGAGFVLALNKKWLRVRAYYVGWHHRGWTQEITDAHNGTQIPFKLGQVHVVDVEPHISVANLIGQSGCGYFMGLAPIRYGAIEEGLLRLRERMKDIKWSMHAPRFGSGLAGGEWPKIEEIIKRVFWYTDVSITVYDFKQ